MLISFQINKVANIIKTQTTENNASWPIVEDELSPIRSGKLNWIGSFSSFELSWVQFSAVHWTGDDRRPTPSRVLDSHQPARLSYLIAGFRPMIHEKNPRRPTPIASPNRRGSSQVVAQMSLRYGFWGDRSRDNCINFFLNLLICNLVFAVVIFNQDWSRYLYSCNDKTIRTVW